MPKNKLQGDFNSMKRIPKRATALMLSLIFILTAFAVPLMSVNAAVEEIDIEIIDFPRGGGTDTWGHPALNYMNGWNQASARLHGVYRANNKGYQVAYCVQAGVPLKTGDKAPEILPTTFLADYNNGRLDANLIQLLLGRIFQYGYTGTVTTSLSTDQVCEQIATQMLVWEVIIGERNPDFTHYAPPSNLDRVTDRIRSDHPERSTIFAHYNRIVTSVQNHSKIPSFMNAIRNNSTINELVWDGSRYTKTLTDTNGVLSNFDFSSTTSGVTFTKSGNNLTISTTTAPSGVIDINATKTGAKRSANMLMPLIFMGGINVLERSKNHLNTNEIYRKPHVAHNNGNNEWYTPAEYISAARSVMGGIDLDPASSDQANETVKATKYYTIRDNGLSKEWHGRVWLNPPYANKIIKPFIEKLCLHTACGDVTEAIILVNNATETAWFNALIKAASAIVFPKKRIQFYMPDGKTGSPLQGQAILYIGFNPSAFLEIFGVFGWGAFIRDEGGKCIAQRD
jgi:phage N-6-adenine-methyltransferase